jgi:hypothetical protein
VKTTLRHCYNLAIDLLSKRLYCFISEYPIQSKMRIDSLLNDGPAETIINSTKFRTHITKDPATMPTPSPRNSSLSYAPYTPYQYSTSVIREENVPSNGSYNSPSLDFSMAATSPTKPSVSQSKNSAWRSGGYKDAVQSDKGTVTNYPEDEKTPRVLPPFTSFVRMQYQIPDPVVGDGGLSPHSTRQNHITLVSDLARYFHISPYDVLYNQSQSGYQRQNHGASSPQTKSRLGTTGTDPLMRFADVAMECSTVRGRRNLDEFAAAEVLTIPRGGSRVGPVSGKKSSFVQLEPLSRVRRTESISIE